MEKFVGKIEKAKIGSIQFFTGKALIPPWISRLVPVRPRQRPAEGRPPLGVPHVVAGHAVTLRVKACPMANRLNLYCI